MEISKHSYGAVFESLLDGIKDDVVVKTASKKETTAPIGGMDIFSSNTIENLKGIQDDEFKSIVAELQFAADNAKVQLTDEDVGKFASRAYKDSLKGKSLERAACKFCNEVKREVAAPESTTRIDAESLFDQITHHKVVSASYPTTQINETSSSGNYLGNLRNPNSIWDSSAIQHLASVKHADEQIKAGNKANAEFRQTQKEAEWKELAEQLSDPNMVGKGIIKSAETTSQEPVIDQKLAANAMSMFDTDRDFSQIPEKGQAEMIKEASQQRSDKAKEAKSEWNQVVPAKKANNDLDFLFK
jgi:hypothetical protein